MNGWLCHPYVTRVPPPFFTFCCFIRRGAVLVQHRLLAAPGVLKPGLTWW